MLQLTKQEAAQVILYVAGDRLNMPEPGGFVRKLAEAMFHADPSNLFALGTIYPELVWAKDQYSNVMGGSEYLEKLAKGETNGNED